MKYHSPDDIEPLREAILKAVHELAEALTAADAYLAASQHLERQLTPSLSSLDEAISKAIEQTKRAGEVLAKLRSIVSP